VGFFLDLLDPGQSLTEALRKNKGPGHTGGWKQNADVDQRRATWWHSRMTPTQEHWPGSHVVNIGAN